MRDEGFVDAGVEEEKQEFAVNVEQEEVPVAAPARPAMKGKKKGGAMGSMMGMPEMMKQAKTSVDGM